MAKTFRNGRSPGSAILSSHKATLRLNVPRAARYVEFIRPDLFASR